MPKAVGKHKVCSKCLKKKSISEFYKNKSMPDGLSYQCIDCKKEIINSKEYKKQDKKYKRQHYLKYRSDYKTHSRKSRLKTYGITIEDYDKMFFEQKGICAICGKVETSINQYGIKRLCVDHNHKSGLVRQLLCMDCNTFLGKVEKNLNKLNLILEYMERHNA